MMIHVVYTKIKLYGALDALLVWTLAVIQRIFLDG